MTIEKLPEFAKNGQKNTDKLNQEDGFPINLKPARQWFNFLFNKVTIAVNQLIDGKLGVTDNAVSASKLHTKRTVSFSGAATGSFTYDGSGNSTAILTLANSGVATGTYGSSLKIPVVTFNAKGQATVATEQDIPVYTGLDQFGLVPKRTGSTTTKYLREDGSWVIPVNTTYAIIPESEILKGTSTNTRAISAERLKFAIERLTPAIENITGNAGTATKLSNQRTVSFSGAATGSFTYDGSANSTAVLTLANSGVVAGSYGSSVKIPSITVNNKGLITSVSEKDITIVDDLTTGGSNKILSAEQGKILDQIKLGKFNAPASSDLNNFVESGTYHCAGTFTNRPSGAGWGNLFVVGPADNLVNGNSRISQLYVADGTVPRYWIRTAKGDASGAYTWVKWLEFLSISSIVSAAAKLSPGRKINGVHFDGTKDILCGFGVNQKWYDELSRRKFNTVYRNTGSVPIFIEYSVNRLPPQSSVQLWVGGEFYVRSGSGGAGKVIIIGPNMTYELKTYKSSTPGSGDPDIPVSATGFSLFRWEEYK